MIGRMSFSPTSRIKVRLDGVEETLLIPLWARAAETHRADGMVNDPRAVELVAAIDYDFDRLAWDWAAQVGIAIRTEILDEVTRKFLDAHPTGLIVNLAAGLDTRFYRLDNGRVHWVDVDLPNSMALRRQFFNDEVRHDYITGSVLDDAWCHQVKRTPTQPVLVIIEGLSMYLTPTETRGLLGRIATFFPGAEILMEAVSPLAAARSDLFFSLRRMDVRFKGGLAHGKDVEAWDRRLHFIEEWFYYDRHPFRWGPLMIGRLIPVMREMFKIVHMKTADSADGYTINRR
jgi:O-methyltransferase involved in polyketide biosynthesis